MTQSSYIKLLFVIFIPLVAGATKPGAVYCGPYTASKPINLYQANNITISGLEISNKNGICIMLTNCSNIKIINCKLGPAPDCGIKLYNCKNVTITDCCIKNVSSGVYAIECQGIDVNHIQVENVTGPYPRGEMVQFDDVRGGGNRVNYNVFENILGKSNPEDMISMYKTHGSPTDPVQIIGNWLRGGGPSRTGGGIMTGDSGGAYILVKNNLLVNPGQYGIGVAAGTHIKIIDNKIYSKKQRFTNVGLYIWNQYGSTACGIDTIMGNKINWTDSTGEIVTSWDQGNCGNVAGWETNVYDSSLNELILPESIVNSCLAAHKTIPTAELLLGFDDSQTILANRKENLYYWHWGF